jgi:Xaa-Pro aminopeptidase
MDELFEKVVPTLLIPGKSEFEILGELDLEARKRGHLGIIRMRGWNNEVLLGHILSGPEGTRRGYLDAPTNGLGLAPAFPQGASRTKIRAGVPVSIDFMVNYEGYMADTTRVFCLGEPSPPYIQTHHKLLDLNQKLAEALQPGQSSTKLFQLAQEIAGEYGFAENFLGYGDDRVSFVGHGIGLEVDEFPFIASGTPFVLTAGMVIALEPKLIFPPHQRIPAPLPSGVVAIENTYLVTDHKPLCLTRFPEKIRILPERD